MFSKLIKLHKINALQKQYKICMWPIAKRSKFVEINVYTRQRVYQRNWVVVGRIQSRLLLENKYNNLKLQSQLCIFFGVYITRPCFDIMGSFLITLNSSFDEFRCFHIPQNVAEYPATLVWLWWYHTRPSIMSYYGFVPYTLKLQLSRLCQGHLAGPWQCRKSAVCITKMTFSAYA
jgi:hypothetical protein